MGRIEEFDEKIKFLADIFSYIYDVSFEELYNVGALTVLENPDMEESYVFWEIHKAMREYGLSYTFKYFITGRDRETFNCIYSCLDFTRSINLEDPDIEELKEETKKFGITDDKLLKSVIGDYEIPEDRAYDMEDYLIDRAESSTRLKQIKEELLDVKRYKEEDTKMMELYYSGVSKKEIASMYGISESKVSSSINNNINKLKYRLKK